MKDSDYDAAIQTWGERVAAHQNVQVPPNAVFTLEFYSQSGGCDTCGYGGGDDRYELEMNGRAIREYKPEDVDGWFKEILSSSAESIAMSIMESEQMLWLMVGANHVDTHLEVLRPVWDSWIEAGGKSWGKS